MLRFKFLTAMLTMALGSPSWGDGPATEARVRFHHDRDGTRFNYDILIRKDTLPTIDEAIFRGSYLGTLEGSRMDPEAEREARAQSRAEEIRDLTASMRQAIPKPAVPELAPVTVPAFTADPAGTPPGPAAALPEVAPDFSALAQGLDKGEAAFNEGQWVQGLAALAQLAPFFRKLSENPVAGVAAMGLRERWEKVTATYLSDGLLLTPHTEGKRLLDFQAQKDTLSGRVLRHFTNLTLAAGTARTGSEMAYLILLDEHEASFTPALVRTLRRSLAAPDASAQQALDSQVRARVTGTENWIGLYEALSPMEAPLRRQVLEGLAAEMLKKRRYLWPEYQSRITQILEQWFE